MDIIIRKYNNIFDYEGKIYILIFQGLKMIYLYIILKNK